MTVILVGLYHVLILIKMKVKLHGMHHLSLARMEDKWVLHPEAKIEARYRDGNKKNLIA